MRLKKKQLSRKMYDGSPLNLGQSYEIAQSEQMHTQKNLIMKPR